jgi:NADH dehydrogenase (ubiquinone) flavoprotein 2
MKKPFEPNAAYQPETFAFPDLKVVDEIIGRYPKGKQQSAVMPLLDLAQRQLGEGGAWARPPHGGWIPRAAMDEIARILDMPKAKVYEVATFYSMYNLAPVGKYLVQVCATSPCWLCGSDKIRKACENHLGIHAGETTRDGMFTLVEVECLGACVNAPVAQINDDFYEDLTEGNTVEILQALASGKQVPVGSQTGRKGSMALNGPTTLKDRVKA